MIKVILQSYRVKNSAIQKKAAVISLEKAVVKENWDEYYTKLSAIASKRYDSYILDVKKPAILNARTIKLLLGFSASLKGCIGLINSATIKNLVSMTGLLHYFITGETAGAIIAKIESVKKRAGRD